VCLGDCHLALAQPRQAASCFEKALDRSESNPAVRQRVAKLKNDIGRLMMEQGNYKEAEEEFFDAIGYCPADQALRLNRARLFFVTKVRSIAVNLYSLYILTFWLHQRPVEAVKDIITAHYHHPEEAEPRRLLQQYAPEILGASIYWHVHVPRIF
jgi:tetratricopeptide (TPR) repeat protein